MWEKEIKKLQQSKSLNIGPVASKNHCAGFGPATANGFRKMLGLPEVVWDEMKQAMLDLQMVLVLRCSCGWSKTQYANDPEGAPCQKS